MREILFRGKRLGIGEWVEGYFFKAKLYRSDDELSEFISVPHPEIKGVSSDDFLVDPDTVGQFTGLTDKNGQKIFEGDIVEGYCHSQRRHELQRCEVAYGRDGFEARHHVVCGGEQRYYTYKVLFSKDVVVIGNIHDNPELLEGTEDGN